MSSSMDYVQQTQILMDLQAVARGPGKEGMNECLAIRALESWCKVEGRGLLN